MNRFADLNLSSALNRAITEAGYETMTAVQAQTLPILLGERTDFLGLAATGTGKTAAFALPLLSQIDTLQECLQALVLCPTRELALQVSSQIDKLGKYSGVTALTIYGGTGFHAQQHKLRQGTYVIVATPGRLLDHLRRGSLTLDNVQTVVLDEADEMISMGFQEDLESILRATPATRNIWLFSATLSDELRRVAGTYLKTPKQVHINKTEVLSTTVDQVHYTVREMNKPKALCRLIEAADDFYGVIFCQTKTLAADLTDYLRGHGYPVDSLHGDKDQRARERTLQSFRERKTRILVCTDVASRGLDVKELTHVVNYSLPFEIDSYVHRIGRTARSGQSGTAISLVAPGQMGLIPRIEKHTRSKVRHAIIPSKKEIASKKLGAVLNTFQNVASFAKAQSLLTPDWTAALEAKSKEEIAARFLVMMHADLFEDEMKEPIPAFAQVQERPKPKIRRHSGPRRHNPQKKFARKFVKRFDTKRK